MVKILRVYVGYDVTDGIRVLVDRLWPRGLRRSSANVEIWLKDIAPSDKLRKWFAHNPARWAGFRAKYRKELSDNDKAVNKLIVLLRSSDTVTLVYSARDAKHNNAVVLQEFMKDKFGL
jgi:uncharacterized protein YeaO (DUF488 family)